MKVLVVSFNPKSPFPLKDAFLSIGCEAEEVRYELNQDDTGSFMKKIEQKVRNFKPDILFSFGYIWIPDINISEYGDQINDLKRKFNFRYTYWATDDPVLFQPLSFPLLKCCDYIFTPAEEMIPTYETHGVKSSLLPFACWPLWHYHVDAVTAYQSDMILLANNYNMKAYSGEFSYRINGINSILKPIIDKDNLNLKVYGSGWVQENAYYQLPEKYYGGVLPPGCEKEVYGSCKIALGLQSVGTSQTMLSCRVFEVLGCGTLHLTQYCPSLERYFVNNKHLVWSQSPEETIEQTAYYLDHQDEREKVVHEGQAYVYQYHTYAHRAVQIMKAMQNC